MSGHSERIEHCLARAAECEGLAAKETNATAKTELLIMAAGWHKAAADYQTVDKLESFLQGHTPSHSQREH